MTGKKRCTFCKRVKSLDDFWPDSGKSAIKDGRSSHCKECSSGYAGHKKQQELNRTKAATAVRRALKEELG